MKRVVSVVLAVAMLVGMIPTTAWAAGDALSAGCCEHHQTHDNSCGYKAAIEGSNCTHQHTADCYEKEACIHTHGEKCSVTCSHVCSTDTGCITMQRECTHLAHDTECGGLDEKNPVCNHICEVAVDSEESCYALLCSHAEPDVHDEVCGYVENVAEKVCEYICEECAMEEADAAAVAEVKALIDAIPTLDDVLEMSQDEQKSVYEQTQAAYDAYEKLAKEQKSQIPDANSFFEALFSYFNSLTSEVNTDSALSGKCGENVTWELDVATGTLRISGSGAMDDFSSGNDVPWWFMKDNSAGQNVPWNEHQNSIKKLIIEENVTGIGKYAFGNCTELEEIYFNAAKMEPLPINNCAFFNAGINSDGVVITVGKSVTRIPENLFASYYYYEDGNYLYDCNIVELKFEEGSVCSSISEGAFKHNQTLTDIEIGNAISTVAEDAFYDCASIENLYFNSTVFGYDIPFINVGDANKGFAVTIGSGVTKIPQQLFSNSYISSLIFENNSNCECIGSYSFEYCNLLKTITLPDTVKRIDTGAFRSCESLSSVTIPKNLELIEQESFEYCDALKSIYYNGSAEQWKDISIEERNDPLLDAEISFTDNHTHVFGEWYETKAPTQEAEGEERRDCTGCNYYETRILEKLPDSGDIHEHHYTSTITEPTCTEQGFTTYICDCNDSYVDNYIDAIGHAYNDGEITIEPGCETTGIKTFTCSNDPEHYYTEMVAAVGHSYGAWYETKAPTLEEEGEEQRDCSNCDHFETRTKEKLVPDEVTEGICGDHLTWTLEDNKLVIAGSGDMYDYIWYDVPWVESVSSIIAVEFHGEITSIGNNAFIGGSNITVINFPATLKSIGDFAFDGCTGITKVDIPISVEYIGEFSFRGIGITEITIPEKVTSIGDRVFDECSALEKVNFNAINAEVGNQVFPDSCQNSKDITLFVGKNVKKIPDNLFSSNSSCTSNLKEIIFEEGCQCTEIGDAAFSDSIKLESVELPNNLVTIGANAFSYCGLREVILPDAVTVIGNNAFSNSDKLKNVNIPKNVVSIGNNAFYCCYALEEIDFDATNMGDLPYRNGVFYYAGNQGKGIHLTIDRSVTKIPAYLFASDIPNPNKLKSVVFDEESVCETIGESAFQMCEELSEIVIPTSVTDIGSFAFDGCKSLKTIMIPENTTNIGRYAFADCTGLTEIGFYPTEVSNGAYNYDGIFYSAGIDCGGVTVTIGSNVKRIPGYTFSGYSATYDVPKITSVIFEDGSVCEEIGYGAFRYCTALESITIPNSVESIGSDAFSGCTSLSNVVIPDSVTEMGYSVFTDCPKLISAGSLGSGCNIEFGWSDALPENAFYECASITKLTVPGSVKTIGINALYNCAGLTSAGPIGGGYSYEFGWNDFIPEYAFYYCSGLKNVIIPENIQNLGDYAFYSCTDLERIEFNAIAMNDLSSVNNYVFNKAGTVGNGISLYISKDVTRIPAYLLTPGEGYNSQNDSAKVLSLEFEDGSACETIGEYAFWRCNNLKTIQIPEKVTSIGNTAFSECPSLEMIKFNAIALNDLTYSCFESSGTAGPGINVFIGDKVTRIPAFLFAGFSETYKPSCVKAVSFGANSVCESIEESAFCHSILLTDITLPDSIAVIESNAFDGCTVLKKVSIPEGVMKIDTEVFRKCTSLECVNLPNTIKEIGQRAFSNCSSLKNLQIPSAVTFINDEAFSGCTSLEHVEIPESVASIGNNAFRNCESLTEVLLSEGVTAIGNQVFQNCSSLESVTLPNTLEKMGTNNFVGCTNLISAGPLESECSIEFGWVECIPPQAFYNCKNLQSVIIPKTITTLGEKAFYNCEGLQRISIPETIATLEKEAFYGCTGLTKINFDAVAINKIQSAVFDNAGTAGDGIDVVFGADVKYVPLGLFASHDDSDTKPYIRTVKFARGSVCEAIDASAFKNCTELLWIEIPKSIYTIGDYAFAGCYHLSDVYYEGSEAEWKTYIEQNGLSQIWHPGNEYLIYNNVHYNSFAPEGDDDSTNNDENESSNSNCYVRYFRKWDADTQTAYWGEEPPIVEGLDLGSQVTAETDTSFIANVNNLVGTYVLAETKARDDGMIAADILLSIKPLETKTGTITAIGFTTITIDGVEYSIPENVNVYDLNVGDSVMYHLYNGDLVGINGKGSADDDNDDSAENIGTIRYYSVWDVNNNVAQFGPNDHKGLQMTDETDTAFRSDPTKYLGHYVLVESKAGQEGSDRDILIGMKPVETKTGTVTSVDDLDIVIDGTNYTAHEGLGSLLGYANQFAVYHLFDGTLVGIETLEKKEGFLTYWSKEANSINIKFDVSAELPEVYSLSLAADEKTVTLLGETGSRVDSVTFLCDSNGILYQIERKTVIDGDFSYLTSQNTIASYQYHYNEDWFHNSSYNYQHDLTRMSMRVTMAAGDVTAAGKSDGSENIRKMMTELGFEYSDSFSSYPEPTYDSIGYAFGSKEIISPTNEKSTLIMIAVRGSGYGKEWGGNFRVDTEVAHRGFQLAANQVIDSLENYIDANKNTFHPRVKVWISGFSRAAATTNLVAAHLDEGAIEQIDATDVFAFCFECPQNTTETNANHGLYNNIVNIINPLDIVTKVAMSSWNFGRYGLNYFLPSAETLGETEYSTLKTKMEAEYARILSTNGTEIAALTEEVPGQSDALDHLMDVFAKSVKDRSYYSYNYQETFIKNIGDGLGGGSIELSQITNILISLIELTDSLIPEIIMAGGVNLSSIKFHAHEMPLCLAWLDSIDGLSSIDYKEKRKIFINCPIDVEIYRESTLVGKITNNVPESIENGVATYIDADDQKIVILPTDTEYNIKLNATDNGYMTYTVTEYNLNGNNTERVVSYHNIKLTKGDSLNAIVEDLDEVGKAQYPLTLGNRQEAKPTIDQSGAEVKTINVNAEAQLGGAVYGGGAYLNGEFAKVTAVANAGYQFVGWFVDGEMVSTEEEYRLAVTSDVTITAQFKSSGHNHVAGVEWVSDGTHHWHKCTGCDEKLDLAIHSGGTATCTKKAVCSVCGASYGELASHDYETSWSQGDANGHWHECKNCSAHDTQVKHTPGAVATENTAQICTECGYVIVPATGHVTHTAGSKWFSDGNYHWHKCTGCNEKLDVTTHSGGTATCTKKAVCAVCDTSYGELAPHDYETTWSQGNANGHWHECKNCSAHDTQVKHTPSAAATEDTAQFCTVCGYVITPALGHTCTSGSKWYSNRTYHWHLCTSCGAWVKTSYHSYSSDTDETCNVCGYTRTVTATEPTQETEVAMTETTEATVSDEEVIAIETAPTIVSTETNESLSDDAVSEDTDSHGVSGVLITVFTVVALGSLAALAILLVYKKRRESK